MSGRSAAHSVSKLPGPTVWCRGIWCPVVGGLANQLICYRVGRMLADIHQVPLMVDLSHFQNPGTRPLLLWNFRPVVDVVFHDASTAAGWSGQAQDLLPMLTTRDTPHFWDSQTQSQLRQFYLSNPQGPLLADLWVGLAFQIQVRDYFREPANTHKLSFDDSCLSTSEQALLEMIKITRNTIAVHVRRTDFAYHDGGLLATAKQYNQGISYIENAVGACSVFVFSDEQAWCEKNLSAKGSVYHSPVRGEENGHKDLFLASQCRHKVLTSESTFSQLIDGTSPFTASDRMIVRCSARTTDPIYEEYTHA